MTPKFIANRKVDDKITPIFSEDGLALVVAYIFIDYKSMKMDEKQPLSDSFSFSGPAETAPPDTLKFLKMPDRW